MQARLQLSGITKRFPGVLANDAVSLTVQAGEIHALLGENGAGKSTLMKIINGVTRPDAGVIEWEGREVQIASPAQARALGIGMVFQHFSLFETLTVAENIALSLDPSGKPLSAAQLAARIRDVSARHGLPLDPSRLVHSMSVGERQRVEIVRCLMQSPKLLILDEPTSVLTPQAAQALFVTLRELAAEGMSIVYISHKLDEIRALCSTATVLRHGRVTGHADPRTTSSDELAQLMIGSILPVTTLPVHQAGEIRLQVKLLDLQSEEPFGTRLRDVSFEVRSGEILGIAGISGNGQKELLAVLSGEQVTTSEAVLLDGAGAGHQGPENRRARGLGFVPEERMGKGAVPDMNLAENALLTGLLARGRPAASALARGGVLFEARARALAASVIGRFGVKAPGPKAMARTLSGGNLQKFIVGREILLAPRVLIVAQPTWGVDVGAAALIHRALITLREQGVAVLVVSEDIDELFTISDRIAVIAGGRLSMAARTAQTSAAQIGAWMSGQFSRKVAPNDEVSNA
jgi:simple sugar transport system ATP-binding protein